MKHENFIAINSSKPPKKVLDEEGAELEWRVPLHRELVGTRRDEDGLTDQECEIIAKCLIEKSNEGHCAGNIASAYALELLARYFQ